jgi:uncharacterized membrane protein HdeD (DUF308 family)
MEVVYFPRFVQTAMEMNMTSSCAVLALPVGITALCSGIAVVLYYVFMGHQDRSIRLWGLLPIWLGWLVLQASATRFMPTFVTLGLW